MTDNEIIKALECCKVALMYDEEQSLYGFALDLINRQKAEIERLKAPTNDWLIRGIPKEQLEQEKIEALIDNAKKCAKAEAIKEFAEELKTKSTSVCSGHGCSEDVVSTYDIDKLVKKKVGDSNGGE